MLSLCQRRGIRGANGDAAGRAEQEEYLVQSLAAGWATRLPPCYTASAKG
jgi:hypothetical protein